MNPISLFFDDNSSLDFNSFFDITRHSTDYQLSEILIMLKNLSEDNNLSLLYKAKMIIIEKEFINRMKDWVMFELKNNSHDKKMRFLQVVIEDSVYYVT